MNQKKALWQFPWLYRESALFTAGIIAVGFLLQYAIGPFNFFLLHFPVNLVVAAVLVVLAACGALARKSSLVQWLAGTPMSVTLLGGMLVFSLIMGLTPQAARFNPHAHTLFEDLGFTTVTQSWPFVLLYGLTLISLGMVTARRLFRPRVKDIPFLLNHFGLWLLLLAAGLGAADMQRFVMHVRTGETEWRVYSANKDVLELPLAIQLKKFIMEEYPPRLVIIDRTSGIPQPEGKAWYYQLDPKKTSGTLGDWQLTIEQYVHNAVRAGDTYRDSAMPASTPAAKVTAKNTKTNATATGWVCGGGNIPGFFSGVTLDEKHTMVMTLAEPKRFASDIAVLTKDGERITATLDVNKPLRVGGWMIYQYGYDTEAGKMSSYSSMELVHDAWLHPAVAGMALMCLGAVGLIWLGTGKRRKDA